MELPAPLVVMSQDLPSMPRAVALLHGELSRPDPDLRRIAQAVRADPALTMRLLRAANAPEFGLSGRIGSASEALAVLGQEDIRAMAEQAAQTASPHAIPGLDLPAFWRYSLEVAQFARSLAGVVRQDQGAAFTCGLLHAVGELVMYQARPADMAEFDADVEALDLRRARVEWRRLGYCYADVGAGLARQWFYPQTMVDALSYQVDPFAQDVYEPLAGVIHLASWRARAQLAGLDESALADSFPGTVAGILGLDIDMVLQQDPFDWFSRA
jgi:HD-like signal output (HDOD) protein